MISYAQVTKSWQNVINTHLMIASIYVIILYELKIFLRSFSILEIIKIAHENKKS